MGRAGFQPITDSGRRMKKRRIVRWIGWAAAAAFGWMAFAYLTLPDVRTLADENPATTAFIELRAHEARAEGKAPRRVQRWVPYSRISPHLKRAVLVAEDAAFWQHEGVDYDELQKAMELGFVRGASTITQQLAKNLYLSPSRNPVRKFRELIIARRLEAELEKARIFEIYLNVIEWGDGIYGADAAARTVLRHAGGGGRAVAGGADGRGDHQPSPAQCRGADAAAHPASAAHPPPHGRGHAA